MAMYRTCDPRLILAVLPNINHCLVEHSKILYHITLRTIKGQILKIILVRAKLSRCYTSIGVVYSLSRTPLFGAAIEVSLL